MHTRCLWLLVVFLLPTGGIAPSFHPPPGFHVMGSHLVVKRGFASWYGHAHQGKATASGEPFDMHAFTAATWGIKMGSFVHVKNLKNGAVVTVRINDRGPGAQHVPKRHHAAGVPSVRVIDVSYRAAQDLGMVADGLVPVEVYFCEAMKTPQRVVK